MYLICILSKNNWITRKEGTNQFCSNVLQQSRITLRIAETGWLWELSTLLIRANTSNIFPSDGQENNNIFQCNRLLGHLLAIYKYLTESHIGSYCLQTNQRGYWKPRCPQPCTKRSFNISVVCLFYVVTDSTKSIQTNYIWSFVYSHRWVKVYLTRQVIIKC